LEDRRHFHDRVLDIDGIDHGDVIPMAARKRSGRISPRSNGLMKMLQVDRAKRPIGTHPGETDC
jgi:hypothetical protein